MASQQEQFQHQSEGIKSWLKRKTPKADRFQKTLDTKIKFYIALFGIILAASLYKQSFSSTTWTSLCALVLLVEIYFDNRKLISLLRSKNEQDQKYVSNELDGLLLKYNESLPINFDKKASSITERLNNSCGNSVEGDSSSCLETIDHIYSYEDGTECTFNVFKDFRLWENVVFNAFPALSGSTNNLYQSILNYCSLNSSFQNSNQIALNPSNRKIPRRLRITSKSSDVHFSRLDDLFVEVFDQEHFYMNADLFMRGIALPRDLLVRFMSRNIYFFEMEKLSASSFALKPLLSSDFLSYANIHNKPVANLTDRTPVTEFLDSYQGIETPLHIAKALGHNSLETFYFYYLSDIDRSSNHKIPYFLHSIFAIDRTSLVIPLFAINGEFDQCSDLLKVSISDDQILFDYVSEDNTKETLTVFACPDDQHNSVVPVTSISLKTVIEASLSDHFSSLPIPSMEEFEHLDLCFNLSDYSTNLTKLKLSPSTVKYGFSICKSISEFDNLLTFLPSLILGEFYEQYKQVSQGHLDVSVVIAETTYALGDSTSTPGALVDSFRQHILKHDATESHQTGCVSNLIVLSNWHSREFVRSLNSTINVPTQQHLDQDPINKFTYLVLVDRHGVILSFYKDSPGSLANPLADESGSDGHFDRANQYLRLSDNLPCHELRDLFWLSGDFESTDDFDQTIFTQIVFDCLRNANFNYSVDHKSYYYMHHKDDQHHRTLSSLGLSPLSFANIFISCAPQLDDFEDFSYDVTVDTTAKAFDIEGELCPSISLSCLLKDCSSLPCPADFDLSILDDQDRAKFVVTTNDSSSIEGLPAKQQSTHKEFTPDDVSELTYKVNVSQDGNIFIGPEYLRLLNLEPGDEFDVYIHGGSDIILKPNPSEASAEHVPTGLSVTIDNKCIMVISRTSKLSLISDATYSIKFGNSYIRLSLETPCINDILSSYADSLRIHET